MLKYLINKSESIISNGGYFTPSEKNSKDNTTLLISYLGMLISKYLKFLKNDFTIALTLVFLNLMM
jgi:hypothetical protein